MAKIGRIHIALAALGSIFLAGCTVSTKDTIAVAETAGKVEKKVEQILGIENEVSSEKVEDFPSQIAILPFENLTEEAEAPIVMRRILQGHLSTKNYQMMHWKRVDDLAQSLRIDQAMIKNDPSSIMNSFGIDGAIRGRVTDYRKVFAGIYAQITLAVYVELIDINGNVLWFGEFDVTTRAGGVSTTPWGILLNVALATMHLEDENLFAAGDELSREVATAMPEPPGFAGVSGPVISSVIHDGARKILRFGDEVKVGLRGAPNLQASVVLEGLDVVSMQETEPGEYFAEIPVSNTWNQKGVKITGRLTDNNGVTTKRISSIGLLDFDNVAPAQPSAISASASKEKLDISWETGSDEPNVSYQAYLITNDGKTLLGETRRTNLSVDKSSESFEQLEVGVVAKDQAGNESQVLSEFIVAYPIAAMREAREVTQLPAVIDEAIIVSTQSPILIDDVKKVTGNGVIYLAPGVGLEFAKNGKLEIEGSLYAFGEKNNVTFTPASENIAPENFITANSKNGISLNGVKMDGADVAIDVRGGTISINNTDIVDSTYSALMVSGAAKVDLQSVLLQGSNTSGIVVSEQARLSVNNSEFKNNQPFHLQSSSIYPVNAKGNKWDPEASPTTVLGEVELDD